MRNNKGFSLVELIVVIAIMAILAAVAIPTFATFISKAQQASDADYMTQVESAIELAYAQKGYSVKTIEITVTDSKATKFTVAFNETDTTADITADDKTGTNEEADAANVIDWNYKFHKTTEYNDDAKNPDSWNDNWNIK
jgi:prepilin-type N-terminal cleavage/methylation domain-containing protein